MRKEIALFKSKMEATKSEFTFANTSSKCIFRNLKKEKKNSYSLCNKPNVCETNVPVIKKLIK